MGVILDIIDQLVDFTMDSLCIPLYSDGMYRRGFLTALILGFIIGKATSFILYARAQILAFFQPSSLPASRPGPSGSDKARGCGLGFVKLVAAAIVALLIIITVIASQIR